MRIDIDKVDGATDPVAAILAAEGPLATGADDADASRAPLWRILWCCAARQLSPEARARLGALGMALSADEWGQLIVRAHVQGVASLLFEHAAHAGLLEHMPPPIHAQLARDYQHTLLNNRRMQTVLGTVLRRLAAERIPVIPVKGLTLVERVYHHLALRPMSDIDLLVRREDVQGAIAILRSLGFVPLDGMAHPMGFYPLTSAVVEYTLAGGPTIELHWELFGTAAYRTSLPASDVWWRARRGTMLGQPAYALDATDELWFLCVHATAQHHLERLIWLTDIAELVRALPATWDWPGFVAATIAARVALPVAVAFAFCHEALGMELPAGVLDRLRVAGAAPAERLMWDTERADLLSERWIVAAGARIHGLVNWGIFLRGVLLPRLPTLAQLYGTPPRSDPLRLRAYLRHWRRTVPWVARALAARLGRAREG